MMSEMRLGDVIDDHCIKCRRVTNHSVVSILNGAAAKVRCRTCYHDHDYRHEQAPPSKKDLKKAELFIRRAAGEKEGGLEYLKITMEEIIISSLSTGGSGGEDRFTENVTLNFANVKLEYTPQKEDGTADAVKTYIGKIAVNAHSA